MSNPGLQPPQRGAAPAAAVNTVNDPASAGVSSAPMAGRAQPAAPRVDSRPVNSRTTRPAAKKVPRITSLQLKRVDPWTVLKVSLIVSIVMFFVWMIAIGLLYLLFGSLDVISRINDGWTTVTSASSEGSTPSALITPGVVFSVAAVIGAINIVLTTALATIAAFVYNAAAGMAGGVELTLGERD
ncbi:hypothetical protein EH165_00040 [Nakamurella antarctica]|uniref:DUF3566 domain-containing protein n=1 Tax=Nakamurella antarctica TaxID=1902245 RepID=A0A3G8ZHY1_9ACTN|nr:DUF3566 domain-containing protein [Nakamurella antarctica]AZI56800.1 hypothetical protein EH165_00040 [Nakamurella antarctica]